MKSTKVIQTRKGKKKVVTEDGSMESTRHKVHDAIAEINHDNVRRGKPEQSSAKLVGNSKAAQYIGMSTSIKYSRGQYEQIFKGGK